MCIGGHAHVTPEIPRHLANSLAVADLGGVHIVLEIGVADKTYVPKINYRHIEPTFRRRGDFVLSKLHIGHA